MFTAGQVCFGAVGIAVGCKLLHTSLQERSLGIPALASAAIFVGASGLALVQVGTALGEGPSGETTALIGEITMRAGMAFLTFFVWRVFGPDGLAGRLGVAACLAALLATLVWDLRAQAGWWPYDYSRPSAVFNQLAIAAPLAWSCVASTASWLRARRQTALGIGNPVVRNRFALWAVATGAFVAICVLAAAAGQARKLGAGELAAQIQLTRGLLYVIISAMIWLGMFPPAALRGRLAGAG